MKPSSRSIKSSKPIQSGVSRFVHSVKFRLSLWYLAVLALALLIFGITIYSIEERTLSAAVDTEMSALAEQASKVVYSQNGQFKLPQELVATLQQFAGLRIPEQLVGKWQDIPGIKSILSGRYVILLIDRQGQLTQQFGAVSTADLTRLKTLAGEAQSKTEPTTTTLELEGKPGLTSGAKNNNYRILVYPVKDEATGQISGRLVLGLGWEEAATLQNLLWTLVLAGLATLVLTAGGGYWLASRAIKPVSKINRIARSISETDLSRRINLKSRDELGELAATFDGMLNRLENAFERQRQFTTDASHELRTPLTIVNLEVSRLIGGRPRQIEEYERAISIIQIENEYMTRLVNDLLTIARFDSGQVAFNPQNLDLSDLALEVVERLAPLARQNGLELATGELPEVELSADRFYLTRLLSNLVENAIKHSASIGHKVEVSTGVGEVADGPKSGWAWVEISDDGPGIAPEHLPHLFDRFYQVDHTRQATDSAGQIESSGRGSGLGLSIVQWVAQLHQGRVQVESEPGRGATFKVWLPSAKTNPQVPDSNYRHF